MVESEVLQAPLLKTHPNPSVDRVLKIIKFYLSINKVLYIHRYYCIVNKVTSHHLDLHRNNTNYLHSHIVFGLNKNKIIEICFPTAIQSKKSVTILIPFELCTAFVGQFEHCNRAIS
jgi:hypothetical protein